MKKTLLFVLLISGFCFGQKYELAEDFYPNGLPKAINTYKVSKNKIELIKTTEWYIDGQKRFEGTYKNGKLYGLGTEWYIDGQKKFEGTYKNWEKDGKWTWWYENGLKKWEGTYKDGKKDGLRTEWYENGNKEIKGTFKDDELISSKCWDKNGNEKECD